MQCRVCMKTKCNILFDMSVADTVEGQTLFDCFNYCTQLHATASDSFPKTLCKTCTRKLRIAYSFRKCALQSNVMFEKLLIVQKSKKQTTVNSIMDSAVYSDDPLRIEFIEALKVVKESDREQFQLVENGGNELSNLEVEYVYDSPLVNELLGVEQSQTSCYNDNKQSQAHIIEEAYEESALAGIEECETDTVEYIEEDLEKHKELRVNNFNLLNKLDKCSNTSLSPYKKCVKQKHENKKENASTSDCDIPCDDQTKIKNSMNSGERISLNTKLEETERIEIEFATNRTQCLYCKQIYSSDGELQYHVKRHLFKCSYCTKICTDVNRCYRHMKRLHNSSEIEVPATQTVMENVEINEDKRIICKVCNETYSTIAAYRSHLTRKHNSENSDAEMSCDVQTVKYKDGCAQKELHGTITSMEEPNHYKICENAAYETSVSINIYTQCDRNTKLSTEENPQEKLDNHKLKEKEKYLCSFCPRVLSSKRAVEIHEGKQHLNIDPDLKECTFCQKKFNKVYLRKHIENVHIGERKFKCDICGNMYKTNDNVMRHRQLHTKDRNFPCTVCDKRFTEKSELKVHMRLHTGEKPYACNLCERRFRIRVHLTYHLQQHARIKHKCNVCGKEFKHVKSLRNHLYLHTDVMPYRCAVCGYGSVKRDYFVKHMLHKHDKTMSVDELFAIFQANTGRSPYVKVVDDIDMNDEHTQDIATSN